MLIYILDGIRETVTVLETVAADRYTLPPMVIYKGKAYYKGWHTSLEGEDGGTVFAISDKGWTNQVLGLEYLQQCFEPSTWFRCGPGEYRLLIVDGHNSHFSWDFQWFYLQHNIVLFCIPPHTTHIVQPLDVGLFSPLQHYYSKEVDKCTRLGTGAIRKGNFMRYVLISTSILCLR